MIGRTFGSHLRRTAALGLAAVLASGGLVLIGGATPALATANKTINLSPGDKDTITFSSPAIDARYTAQDEVNGESSSEGVEVLGNYSPAECKQDVGCEDFPIDVHATKAEINSPNLLLTIAITWKVIATVPTPIGEEKTQTEEGFLWADPPIDDQNKDPIYSEFDNDDDPGYMDAFDFTKATKFDLEVIQSRPSTAPVTVKIAFVHLKNPVISMPKTPKLPTGSKPAGKTSTAPSHLGQSVAPPSTTVVSTGGISSVTSPSAITAGGTPSVAVIKVPKIAGGRISNALSNMATVTLPNELGTYGAQTVTGTSGTSAASASKVSPFGSVIALGVVPLLGLLLFFFILWRRRKRDDDVQAAAV